MMKAELYRDLESELMLGPFQGKPAMASTDLGG